MSGFTDDTTPASVETDLAGNPLEELNEEAVKETRRSLTRGPVAVTLLGLASLAAAIGLGGFWAYPAWQEIQEARTETENVEEMIREKQVELANVKRDNELSGPSEVELAFAAKIAPVNEPAKNIRDIVRMAELDPSTPDDNLAISSFNLAEAKSAGDYVVVGTTINVTGPAASLLRLLEVVRDPTAGRRLATPRSVNIAFSSVEKLGEATTPAQARFHYLLRQKSRHLITEDEEGELEVALAARFAKYQDVKAQIATAQQRVRGLEGENAPEGVAMLTRTDALARAEAELTRLRDELKNLEREAKLVTEEVAVVLKLDLYAEHDPKAKQPT